MTLKLVDSSHYNAYKDAIMAYYDLEAGDSQCQAVLPRLRSFLRQVFSNDSVLQLIPHAVIPLLQAYSKNGPPDDRLEPLIPALGMIFQESDRQNPWPHLLRLCGTLADRAQSVFNQLVTKRKIINATSERPPAADRVWEETGSYYGRLPLRYRPYYDGRDDSKAFDNADNANSCRKFFSTYSKRTLTGGLMGLWCPHLICLGFHLIPHAEGRNDVFSALWVYFDKAPQTVVYDFACQLAPYSMSREPEFFKDTCFAIDEMHATGHTACSSALFLSNYMQVRPDIRNVNSSAVECCNSGLSRLKKSISYMGEKRAIVLAFVYVNIWNRKRERMRQMGLEAEFRRLQ